MQKVKVNALPVVAVVTVVAAVKFGLPAAIASGAKAVFKWVASNAIPALGGALAT